MVGELGGAVAASHHREGGPGKEIALLADEIDAGPVTIGGRRKARLGRVFGVKPAETVMRHTDRPVLIPDDRASGRPAVPP